MSQFLSAWHFDLFVATNLAAAVLLYSWAIRRINRQVQGLSGPTLPTTHSPKIHPRNAFWGLWPRSIALSFYLGLALIALVYLGPIAAWSHTFFWAQMTQHLVVTMVAAPLLVLGAPITAAFRACGPAQRRQFARALRSPAVAVLTNPILTWVLFAGALLGTHFTSFYDWTLANHGAMVMIKQPMFLITAFLYYLPLMGANLLPKRPSHAVRLISLALMMIPEALVGAVIYFSPVILYDGFDTIRPFGLEAKPDQQISGAVMWGLVMSIESFWMMMVAADWFKSEERRSRKVDQEIAAETSSTSTP